MAAVHFAGVRVAQALAHQFPEQRVLFEPDFVREVERLMRRNELLVVQRPGDLRGNILNERSAARDVQHLQAAADGEDRQVALPRFLDQRDFEVVALRRDFP